MLATPTTTGSAPRRCTWPTRPCRSRTTARAGRSPCSRTLLAWLRCRWRIENLFTYLEDNYGIHWLCDYHASLQDDDHLIANPERTAGRARLREAEAA